MTLRANWRKTYGPLDMDMPDDGVRAPMVMPPYPAVHEDAEDSINADGTHGPENPGSPALSGIAMGHSVQEPENIVLLEEATHKRTVFYNWEHWIRQLRYAIARTEMLRDTIGPRRVVQYANLAHTYWDEKGPVYFGPGWYPDNVHQYHEAALMNPHTCIPVNGRALGWVMYGEAVALKVDKNRSRVFAQMCLDTCSLAADLNTGQVCSGPNTGGEPTDPVNVQYTFHWAILAHGAMALAYQLGLEPPWWVVNGMLSILELPPMDYYGVSSMPAFVYSDHGHLKAATGPGQHGDPEFGWWSSNCAVLFKRTGSQNWKDRMWLYGPTKVNSEEDRKFTMLARGLS